MRNLFRIRISLVAVVAIIAVSFSAVDSKAQCKRFTEKHCLPDLEPYQNNGQINTTTLFEGDSATLNMTFYSLLDYRLMVCSHDVLGDGVYFRVKDSDGEILFTNKDGEEKHWDFRVNSTQDLHIDVVVPSNSETISNMPPSGCVSVVLGYKE